MNKYFVIILLFLQVPHFTYAQDNVCRTQSCLEEVANMRKELLSRVSSRFTKVAYLERRIKRYIDDLKSKNLPVDNIDQLREELYVRQIAIIEKELENRSSGVDDYDEIRAKDIEEHLDYLVPFYRAYMEKLGGKVDEDFIKAVYDQGRQTILSRAKRNISQFEVTPFLGCQNRADQEEDFKVDELKQIKNSINVLKTSAKDPAKVAELIKTGEGKVRNYILNNRRRRLCSFQKQIKNELAKIENPDNKAWLEELENISSCFSNAVQNNTAVTMDNLQKDTFQSIFSYFKDKAQRKDLTEEDCDVLRKTYSVWSSFYEESNNQNRDLAEDRIPLYNVNPHNNSLDYWIQEHLKGNIAPDISLLHVDTHTDLGHIHRYNNSTTEFSRLDFMAYVPMLKAINNGDREELVRIVSDPQNLRRGEVSKKIIEYVETKDMNEIAQLVKNEMASNVHSIAQPLVGAMAGNITDHLALFLPPWSKRLNPAKCTTRGECPASALQLSLDQGEENGLYYLSEKSDQIPQENENLHTDDSPIRNYNNGDRKIKDISLSVARPWQEVENEDDGTSSVNKKDSVAMPKISSYLKKCQENGFILDLDLDAFVSEGRENDLVTPISYGRTPRPKHSSTMTQSHEESNETSSQVELFATEMDLIKDRVDVFFKRLAEAKEEGCLPKVVTIADSTILRRALEQDLLSGDGSGGDYTPSCLVFLVNYMVRQQLKQLYFIDEQFTQ